MTWVSHYLITDLYNPIWPNVAASGLSAIWAVRRFKIHLSRHRKWQAKHFTSLHAKVNLIHSATVPTTHLRQTISEAEQETQEMTHGY